MWLLDSFDFAGFYFLPVGIFRQILYIIIYVSSEFYFVVCWQSDKKR